MEKSYDVNNIKNKNKDNEQVLATKIKIIISEHDIESYEENIVHSEIIKLQNEEEASSQQMITALGSVRGVKNRVKERISQFLSGNFVSKEYIKEEKKGKVLQTEDANKIIVYTTSLGIVRQTKADCLYVIHAFRSLMLKTEERDIVSHYYHEKFMELFPNARPPQVVIKSFPVGGRKEIEELIESSEIHLLTKGIEKVEYSPVQCSSCSNHGYLPCPVCLGSCKSRVTRIGNTRELSTLKCTHCKQGLVRCVECIDMV